MRITDSDVSHPLDLSTPAAAEDKKKEQTPRAGAAQVEIAEYNQTREGDALIVTGSCEIRRSCTPTTSG